MTMARMTLLTRMTPVPSNIRSSRKRRQRVVEPDAVSSVLKHCRVRVLRREKIRFGEQPEGEEEKEELKGRPA
jgi:hypothetical protein